jgi:hypothetical protein
MCMSPKGRRFTLKSKARVVKVPHVGTMRVVKHMGSDGHLQVELELLEHLREPACPAVECDGKVDAGASDCL